jgi:hypothetical protein
MLSEFNQASFTKKLDRELGYASVKLFRQFIDLSEYCIRLKAEEGSFNLCILVVVIPKYHRDTGKKPPDYHAENEYFIKLFLHVF